MGAEAFVADRELSKDVAAVISIEMRGTYGGSNMFETSSGNRWLIRHAGNSLERPQASSLFYSIYKLLPNDTDVTVFRRAGVAAMNFAALRGVNWYHTPLDDVAHASPKTLQHHGDNALAMLRVMGNADLQARGSNDATYFDVFAWFLVWWPQQWTLWMAIISLVALIVAARKQDARAMTFGVLAAFTALLFAGVIGMALAQLATRGNGAINFVARPLPGIIAMWLVGIAGALFAAAVFNRRENPRAMLYGIAIVWHMIGIALALTVSGAAYLFVLPALVVTLLAWTHLSETTIATLAAFTAAVLFFPLTVMFYDALGGRLLAVTALLVGVHAMLVAPLFSRYKYATAVLVLAVISAVVATLQPAYTAERPRPIPLSYVDDARAQSPRWVTWTATDELRKVAPFASAEASLFPWNRGAAFVAPAPLQPLPRVTVSGERKGNIVTVRVRSPRGAYRLVVFARGATVRRVNGTALPPGRTRSLGEWRVVSAAGVEEIVVELLATRPVEIAASDLSLGLPPSGAALLRAREASTATTI
ncbi:MAG TPA: M28 family peptidase, partial [Thermoanaerobaculia bacterium]|nr:M28 family peptidase [Thermoanaerobaculia bacterium]